MVPSLLALAYLMFFLCPFANKMSTCLCFSEKNKRKWKKKMMIKMLVVITFLYWLCVNNDHGVDGDNE